MYIEWKDPRKEKDLLPVPSGTDCSDYKPGIQKIYSGCSESHCCQYMSQGYLSKDILTPYGTVTVCTGIKKER